MASRVAPTGPRLAASWTGVGGGALWGQVWRKERHRVVLRMLKDKSWGPEVIAGGWPGP